MLNSKCEIDIKLNRAYLIAYLVTSWLFYAISVKEYLGVVMILILLLHWLLIIKKERDELEILEKKERLDNVDKLTT